MMDPCEAYERVIVDAYDAYNQTMENMEQRYTTEMTLLMEKINHAIADCKFRIRADDISPQAKATLEKKKFKVTPVENTNEHMYEFHYLIDWSNAKPNKED